MALRKVEGAFCRIRMVLPNDQSEVTIGSGCIVHSESLQTHSPDQPNKSSSGDSGDAFFVLTSKQVFTPAKANRNSKNSFKVEFLKKGDRKLLEYPLDLSYSRELPGRVLGQSEDAEYFTVIPVGHLVTKYNVIKILLKSALTRDRFLGCRMESAENLKSLLSSQQLFCYVCCDSALSRFDFEAYYLNLDGDDFSLNPVSERPECVRKENDFNREAKPCGALLMNTDGDCVGVLTLSSHERKVLPLFLPLLEKDGSTEKNKISRTQGQTRQEIAESATGACNIESAVGCSPSSERLSDGRSYSEEQRSDDTCENNITGAVSSLTDRRELEIGDQGTENEENSSQDSSNSQSDETQPHDDGSISDHHDRSSEDLRSLETREPCSFEENVPAYGTQNALHFPGEKRFIPSTDADNDEEDRSSSVAVLESVDPESKLRQDPVGAPTDRNGNISSTRCKGFQRMQSEPSSVSRTVATVSRPSASRRFSTSPSRCEHIEPGSFVVQKILNNVEVMHMLALHLNTEVCHKGVYIAKSWPHFANEYNVPDDVVKQCKRISSPSVQMFQYICTLKPVTIDMLKEHVQPEKGNRKDVLNELNKSESKDVRELCAQEPFILGQICISLDCGHYNWRALGRALGITADKLELFDGSSEVWPTEMIFTKLRAESPNMKITEIKAILEDMKRDDVCEELLSFEDDATVTTLVRNVDVLSKVTRLLGKNVKGADNWEQFALRCGFSQELCNNLKPSCDPNPIKSVLEYITHANPKLSMASFLNTLKEMERIDVLLALEQFFVAEDIIEIVGSY